MLADHLLDGTIVIAEFAQHLAGVLADTRRRTADRGLIDLEAGRRLRLPHPPDHRLVELDDQVARDDLLVMDDLAAAQDRGANRGSFASSGSPVALQKPCHSESEIVPAVM